MKMNLYCLLLLLSLCIGTSNATMTNQNPAKNCVLENIQSAKGIARLNIINQFKNKDERELILDKYLIKTSNDLGLQIRLFINNKLKSKLSFESDIPYRYKAFLYKSKYKIQPLKLIIIEMIARNDDSDEVDGYYIYLLKNNNIIREFHISAPIYDYYYQHNDDNYSEIDKHNVTEYLSAFIKNNMIIFRLNQQVWKPSDNEDVSNLIQDNDNIYLCYEMD